MTNSRLYVKMWPQSGTRRSVVIWSSSICSRGPGKLAFTSSPSFAFNKGFTGVAGTLPGGADFVSLKQTISDSVDAVVYVEKIAPQIGVDELDVTVASDWGLNRRFDALQRCQRVYVDCLPRKVTYGPVTVDGKRVERG